MKNMVIDHKLHGRIGGKMATDSLRLGWELSNRHVSEGGWKEIIECGIDDKCMHDDNIRAGTALMLENNKCEMYSNDKFGRIDDNGRRVINEVTRSANVGGFSDFLFPIIRASYPSNPVNELFTVQPTNRRVATVVYWSMVYGSNKGSISAGQRWADPNIGIPGINSHYSDGVIDAENLGTATNANTTYNAQLQYYTGSGVVPGTVTLSTTTSGGVAVFADNGIGGFVGVFSGSGTVSGSSTINYATGVISLIIGTETFTAVGVTAAYRWNSEGSPDIPQMDVQITTTTAEAKRRALKLNYSLEALQDVNAEFGVDLEDSLLTSMSEEINWEIARELIGLAWGLAPTDTTFPITPPSSNYSKQQYFLDFMYYLNLSSNNIELSTQKGYGNWLLVDAGAASVIETMGSSMFVAAPRPPNVMGVHFIGTLGQFRVYKDLHLQQLPGASSYGNILMGFKSADFFQAGIVFAPYMLAYSTPTVTLADFNAQKGFASRYATKVVNNLFYRRILLSA